MTRFFVNQIIPGVFDVVTDSRIYHFNTPEEFLEWLKTECHLNDDEEDLRFQVQGLASEVNDALTEAVKQMSEIITRVS